VDDVFENGLKPFEIGGGDGTAEIAGAVMAAVGRAAFVEA
jgi:hypothetical protein